MNEEKEQGRGEDEEVVFAVVVVVFVALDQSLFTLSDVFTLSRFLYAFALFVRFRTFSYAFVRCTLWDAPALRRAVWVRVSVVELMWMFSR